MYKKNRFEMRLSDIELDHLNKICEEEQISRTDFFRRQIDVPLSFSNHRLIFSFINLEDAHYAKIGNNINQVARIVNSQKNISDALQSDFNSLLRELYYEQKKKFEIINKIFKILAEKKR